MSKYLVFTEVFGDIVIFSKKQDEPLGKITYYPRWRQHVLEPLPGSIFNDECLMDIILQIKGQNAIRKSAGS